MTGETLTTGWEPGAPVGDSLARRFVHAYADRTAAMAARAGGRVRRVAGAVLADPASPFGYDNAVVLTAPPDPGDLPRVLDEAARFFPPHRWWVLLSLFALPDPAGYGLVRVGHPPLMFRPPGPLPPSPPGLVIRTVPDADPADFERVLVAGYGLAEVGRPAVADPRPGDLLHLVVGYAGGEPVATAGACVGHGVVEVDWVAVLPGHRGRGFGGAVTAAACAVAPELPSLLISSDDGHPVYRRLGYWDLFRTTMWEHPPS
ncbi:GNAT family N-acetyltransferase [Pseudonocardia tropica]|uniref:GNAT family N-acetyltransferase n=1 Tax=Pseudonocardia tropica TaxID=681289 RepID=A0ABV1JYW9_9PSEU